MRNTQPRVEIFANLTRIAVNNTVHRIAALGAYMRSKASEVERFIWDVVLLIVAIAALIATILLLQSLP
jgi:hypothetical protein